MDSLLTKSQFFKQFVCQNEPKLNESYNFNLRYSNLIIYYVISLFINYQIVIPCIKIIAFVQFWFIQFHLNQHLSSALDIQSLSW